jgi:hypothetical protein
MSGIFMALFVTSGEAPPVVTINTASTFSEYPLGDSGFGG